MGHNKLVCLCEPETQTVSIQRDIRAKKLQEGSICRGGSLFVSTVLYYSSKTELALECSSHLITFFKRYGQLLPKLFVIFDSINEQVK